MGWRYILVNHTRKVIEETDLKSVWNQMHGLKKTQGWEETDNVEMMFEDGMMETIAKLVVKEGYRGHYPRGCFDGFF